MRKRLGWPCGMLSLVLLSQACNVKVGDDGVSVNFAVGAATDEWTRDYDLPPGGRLEIVNANGPIELSRSSGARVEVRATREARAGSDEAARTLLQTTDMNEEVGPARVRIDTRVEDAGDGGFRGPRVTIHYDVRVPPGLDVFLETGNGSVTMQNIEGRLQARATNGGITGRGLSGSVEASTVNGRIQIDLEAVTAETRIVTVNGGISLTVGPDVSVDLDATVVNGAVDVADALRLTSEEHTRQRVVGRLNRGGPRVVLHTTNGGVRVGVRDEPGV